MRPPHHAHVNRFPGASTGRASTEWIDALCADFSGHSFLRRSSEPCPLAGRFAYGLDRLAAAAMSIPYKRKIQPHLSDTTLQEYIDYHAFYSQQRFLDDPSSAFAQPPFGHSVVERATRRRRWDP